MTTKKIFSGTIIVSINKTWEEDIVVSVLTSDGKEYSASSPIGMLLGGMRDMLPADKDKIRNSAVKNAFDYAVSKVMRKIRDEALHEQEK